MNERWYLSSWPRLTPEERERLKLNDARFAALTEAERNTVRSAIKFFTQTKFISGEHYSPEAFNEVVEYYGDEPERMRVIDGIERDKAAGWTLSFSSKWEPSSRVARTAPDHQPTRSRRELVTIRAVPKPALKVLALKRLKCPWDFLRPLMSKKKRMECDLAIEDLRVDALERHESGWSRGRLRVYFAYHSTLIYRDVLWACLRAAFAAGWLLGKLR